MKKIFILPFVLLFLNFGASYKLQKGTYLGNLKYKRTGCIEFQEGKWISPIEDNSNYEFIEINSTKSGTLTIETSRNSFSSIVDRKIINIRPSKSQYKYSFLEGDQIRVVADFKNATICKIQKKNKNNIPVSKEDKRQVFIKAGIYFFVFLIVLVILMAIRDKFKAKRDELFNE